MAEKGGSVSMSALGSFYDAIYELTSKQVAQNGELAAPDLVPYQVNDQIADGIITVAASATGMTSVEPIVTSQLLKPLQKIMGNEIGPNVIIKKPDVNAPQFKQDGENIPVFSGRLDNLEVNLNAATATALLTDKGGPAAAIDKMVDDYWKSYKLAKNAEMIASLFGDPNKEIAAIDIKNRAYEVDKDIRGAIATAHAEVVKKEAETGLSRVTNLPENMDIAGSMPMRSGALDTAIALTAGIASEAERNEFAKFYDEKIKQEVVAEYNNSVKGSSYSQVKSFDELFVDSGRGKKLSSLSNNELFDPSSGGMAIGDLVQNSYMNVLSKHAMSSTVPAPMQRHLLNMYDVVKDQKKFGDITRGVSLGVDSATRDVRPMLKLGLNELEKAHGGTNKKLDRALTVAKQGLQKDVIDSAAGRKMANSAAYMYYRWRTMPQMNKIFSPFGVLTGSTWKDVSHMAGGITGVGVTKASAWKSLGLKQLESVGTGKFTNQAIGKLNNKIDALQNKIDALTKAGGSASYIAQLEKQKAKFRSQLAKRERSLGSEFSKSNAKGLGWKDIDLLSHRANFAQKAAYGLYAFSPGAFFGGMLNGDTFQRLAWMGSGFGKNLPKYIKNSKGKDVLDTSGMKWYGRLSMSILNSKGYRAVARISRGVGWVVNLPAQLAQSAMRAAQAAMRKAVEEAFKALAKRLLSESVRAALAYITAGVSKVLEWAYAAANFVTFGALDKLALALLKFTTQLIIALIVGIVALSVLGFQNLAEVGGPQYLAQNLGNGGLFAPDPNYDPVLVIDNPTAPPSGGLIGYPPDGPGSQPTYSGSCQEIFEKVKAESIFNGTNAENGKLITPSGGNVWCDAFQSPTVRCRFEDIDPWCRNCPNSATRLFRHELTHVAKSGSEFCADLVGEGGGGYAFQAPDLFGSSAWYTAVQIAEKLVQNTGIPMGTLKLACVGNSLALSQVAHKGINLAKYNSPQGHRKVSCL